MAWLKETARRIGLRGLSTLLAVLLAFPFAWGTGLYAWLSPFIMLNSVFALKSWVWLNGLALAILIIAVLRKRWFCRYLCPVGWSCDLVSSCSRRKSCSARIIPPVGKWLAITSLAAALAGFPLFILLDPMSIFNGFFAAFFGKLSIAVLVSFSGFPVLLAVNWFFPGIWCARLCPLGGLQDELIEIKNLAVKIRNRKKQAQTGINRQRRLFLATGIGLASGLMIPRILPRNEKKYFRPPGSVPPGLFNILCLRCGSCIKACPTGILNHRIDSGDITGWMIPEIHFDKGYCLENCNLCSRVCSSGAITLFSPDAKARLTIGLAEVKLNNCLLTKNSECDQCKKACPYDAISIEAEKGTLRMSPAVHPDKCVGCGACAVICPVESILMIPL